MAGRLRWVVEGGGLALWRGEARVLEVRREGALTPAEAAEALQELARFLVFEGEDTEFEANVSRRAVYLWTSNDGLRTRRLVEGEALSLGGGGEAEVVAGAQVCAVRAQGEGVRVGGRAVPPGEVAEAGSMDRVEAGGEVWVCRRLRG